MERPALLKHMIEDYRRKADTYLAMIREWELEMNRRCNTPPKRQRVARSRNETRIASVEIRASRQFVGKSQPEAVRALLERVKHPLTTDEIMSGIQRGGAVVKSNKRNFYSMLDKHKDFERVGRNTWYLVEWPGSAPKRELARRAKPKRVERRPEAEKAARVTAGVAADLNQPAIARDARAS